MTMEFLKTHKIEPSPGTPNFQPGRSKPYLARNAAWLPSGKLTEPWKIMEYHHVEWVNPLIFNSKL